MPRLRIVFSLAIVVLPPLYLSRRSLTKVGNHKLAFFMVCPRAYPLSPYNSVMAAFYVCIFRILQESCLLSASDTFGFFFFFPKIPFPRSPFFCPSLLPGTSRDTLGHIGRGVHPTPIRERRSFSSFDLL